MDTYTHTHTHTHTYSKSIPYTGVYSLHFFDHHFLNSCEVVSETVDTKGSVFACMCMAVPPTIHKAHTKCEKHDIFANEHTWRCVCVRELEGWREGEVAGEREIDSCKVHKLVQSLW